MTDQKTVVKGVDKIFFVCRVRFANVWRQHKRKIMILSKQVEGTYRQIPAGTYLARCYRFVDMGTQTAVYDGETKSRHVVMIQWEVHGSDENGEDLVTNKGEPLTITKNYTASMNEASTLRKHLRAWRGRDFTPEEEKGFKMENILGQWCMLTVEENPGSNGRMYTNVSSVSPVHATLKKNLPQGYNQPDFFSLADRNMAVFERLSDRIKEKIQQAPEWAAKKAAPASVSVDVDEDIPF
jgi:hypothetical protein